MHTTTLKLKNLHRLPGLAAVLDGALAAAGASPEPAGVFLLVVFLRSPGSTAGELQVRVLCGASDAPEVGYDNTMAGSVSAAGTVHVDWLEQQGG